MTIFQYTPTTFSQLNLLFNVLYCVSLRIYICEKEFHGNNLSLFLLHVIATDANGYIKPHIKSHHHKVQT